MDTTVGSYLNNLNSKVSNHKSYDQTPMEVQEMLELNLVEMES